MKGKVVSGRGRRRGVLAGLAAAACSGGCAAPIVATAGLSVAQFGASSYLNGKLDAARRVPIEAAFKATRDAMTPMAFEITEERGPSDDNDLAYLATKERDGTAITVRLTRVSNAVCKIEIRVGVFGDQTLSRLILANIDQQLRSAGYATPDDEPAQP
jgi:hypothetical protein